MGFLSGLAKFASDTAKNSQIDSMREMWEKLEKLSTERLLGIFEDNNRFQKQIGMLVYLQLEKKCATRGVKLSEEERDLLKRKCSSLKRAIELAEDYIFDDIRGAIRRTEENLSRYY
ncbi:hypothetical protein [Chromatium okenii]|uniref:hypothetical protein n=1 Tax=Chromatium okenii TaxID=61644 RepID=UPI0026EBC6AF|nr:hypothetical protein [Chromatium okenii]MBV5308182.1 hypothetical protein [Chromatium okenii]